MSDERINIAKLCERAKEGHRPHRVTLKSGQLAALVEAVEAARRYQEHEQAEPKSYTDEHATWEHDFYVLEQALFDALARFDFGDATRPGEKP